MVIIVPEVVLPSCQGRPDGKELRAPERNLHPLSSLLLLFVVSSTARPGPCPCLSLVLQSAFCTLPSALCIPRARVRACGAMLASCLPPSPACEKATLVRIEVDLCPRQNDLRSLDCQSVSRALAPCHRLAWLRYCTVPYCLGTVGKEGDSHSPGGRGRARLLPYTYQAGCCRERDAQYVVQQHATGLAYCVIVGFDRGAPV